MKAGSLVSESLLSGTEGTEVLRGLGHNISTELHDDASSGLAANGNVKVNLGIRPTEQYGRKMESEMTERVRETNKASGSLKTRVGDRPVRSIVNENQRIKTGNDSSRSGSRTGSALV